MRPMGPRVLVRPIESPRPKSSLLYIPETVDADPSPYALVLAVGNGYPKLDGTRQPLDVAAGDTVIIKKYSSTVVNINGEPAAMVMAEDILATVEFN
jgi:chaperonin GroES